jgi:hypothetical protein
MSEENARGGGMGMLWQTNWGHLGDYEIRDEQGNVVLRALYDREDEKRMFTQGNRMFFEDPQGTRMYTLEKGLFSIQIVDATGLPIAEVRGAGVMGTISEGALDFRVFSSAVAKESMPKVCCHTDGRAATRDRRLSHVTWAAHGGSSALIQVLNAR